MEKQQQQKYINKILSPWLTEKYGRWSNYLDQGHRDCGPLFFLF